ncbi:lysophospholipid acyltransferase family protein [Nocardia jejuensis]|uniref:lysophospholipid acyltransferase family protein n=1 Tax=Nocardia jejuensis TaxID=328049 RepID=UPI001FDFDDB9|nr:lysophospholipid acyltransferase family protein [Nocardia jejuensis]
MQWEVSSPVDTVAEWVRRLVPDADLSERDPQFITRTVELGWRLVRVYFRAEVRGIERVPAQGPVLLVGNHTGGITAPEVPVTALAFFRHFGADRSFYQLAHDLVVSLPGVGQVARKYGTLAAAPDNARDALRSGAAVLVYPGGDWEVMRPTSESDQIDFAGRKGFLRLALAENVPIVPVVTIGGQETLYIFTRGDRIARALRLDRLMRVKVFPISLALPWGINISDAFGHIPLPAKIVVEFRAPIDLRAELEAGGHEPDDLDAAYELVTGRMQDRLSELADERRFPVIG